MNIFNLQKYWKEGRELWVLETKAKIIFKYGNRILSLAIYVSSLHTGSYWGSFFGHNSLHSLNISKSPEKQID